MHISVKPSMIYKLNFVLTNFIRLKSSLFFTILDILTMCEKEGDTFNQIITVSNVMQYTGGSRRQAINNLEELEELEYIYMFDWSEYKFMDKFFIELIPVIKFRKGEELCR